jgi:hypothetical protein
MHTTWESVTELRTLKKELTIRDNKIMNLENNITTLIDLNHLLLSQIDT